MKRIIVLPITICCIGFVVQLLLETREVHGFVISPASTRRSAAARTNNPVQNGGPYRRRNVAVPSLLASAFVPTKKKTTTTQLAMFDQLTAALTAAMESTIGTGSKQTLTEKRIEPALKSVRRALLDADVNVNVADTLIAGVRQRSLGTTATAGVTPGQQFVKAMNDELVDLMGGDTTSAANAGPGGRPASSLAVGKPGAPAVVVLAGLQGAGKTTASAKLALYLKEREVDYDGSSTDAPDGSTTNMGSRLPKRNRRVLLVAADTYRPAAVDQLQILGRRIGVEVFFQPDQTPVEIVRAALSYARNSTSSFDTVIIDTAGRQVIDAGLMNELKAIQKIAQPDETLLIVDAMTGQEAASLTAAFDGAVGLTGAILTKIDGDARGGAAVSVRAVSGRPIKFVGTGETMADLEPFFPDRMASRILGMGDVVSLVEKAAADVSDADAEKMAQKMLDATFDFDDFMKQSEMMSNLGGMANIAKMLPGNLLGNNAKDVSAQIAQVEKRLKKYKAMVSSMNKLERANPDLLIRDKDARDRLIRITKGSGTTLDDGLQFIAEFQQMRTMMSRMSKKMGPMAAANANNNNGGDGEMVMPEMGNRAQRRATGKKIKKTTGRGGGGGFG